MIFSRAIRPHSRVKLCAVAVGVYMLLQMVAPAFSFLTSSAPFDGSWRDAEATGYYAFWIPFWAVVALSFSGFVAAVGLWRLKSWARKYARFLLVCYLFVLLAPILVVAVAVVFFAANPHDANWREVAEHVIQIVFCAGLWYYLGRREVVVQFSPHNSEKTGV